MTWTPGPNFAYHAAGKASLPFGCYAKGTSSPFAADFPPEEFPQPFACRTFLVNTTGKLWYPVGIVRRD